MVKLDYKAIKTIFSFNGVFDGRSYYLIESLKDHNEITNQGFDFLCKECPNILIKAERKYFPKSIATLLGKDFLGESWNIKRITKYIDKEMKCLFNLKLLCSERNFVTFDIIEDEDGFDIDIDSIH